MKDSNQVGVGTAPGRARKSRRRWWLLATGLVGVLMLAAGLWYLRRPVLPPEPPAVDTTEVDPEVAEAVAEARQAVVQAPRSAQAWGRFGMVLLAHNFFTDAVTALAEAERLDPTDARWPYLQALIFDQTDPQRETATLRRAMELSPEPAVRLRLAEVLLSQGQLDEAEGLFHQVERTDRESARAQFGLAQVARARGDLAASLDHLQRAANAPGARARTIHALLAEVYAQRGQEAEAERERQRVAALPPDGAWPDPFAREAVALRVGRQARIDRANYLRASGQLAEAIAVLHETTMLYPDFDAGWLALGAALLQAQEYRAAEDALRHAVACAPGRFESQYVLGLALYQQRRQSRRALRQAADSFARAARLAPLRSSAHLYLGLSLQELGDRSGAIAAYQAALRCGPDSAEAHRRLGEQLQEMADEATTAAALQRLVGCPDVPDLSAVFRADAQAHLRSAARLAPKATARPGSSRQATSHRPRQ